MAEKLTKRLIDGMTYQEGNLKDIRWDSEMAGFGIRLFPSGKKSFVLFYRIKNKQYLYTVGRYGKVTLERARELATMRFGEIADNQDPLKERKVSKRKNSHTVEKTVKAFIEKYAKEHTRNWQEAERILEKDVVPVIGKKPVDEVTKDDIIKILDNVVKRKARIMANRTLAHTRRFFNWCVERNLIPYSPAFKVAAPSKSISRNFVIADVELKEIWEVSSDVNQPFASLIKFLFLTGQRRGEAASMKWTDIDKKKKLWTIPRENNKSDREHIVPLSDMALSIIEDMPKLGVYIFSDTGKRPFENFSRDKKIIDRAIDNKREARNEHSMRAWRIHDIRRTLASGMAQLGVAPHVVEKLLNHSGGIISGVAAVYNRYEYQDEMRDAVDKWASHVQEILENKDLKKSFVARH